jgi:hypothetical protein
MNIDELFLTGNLYNNGSNGKSYCHVSQSVDSFSGCEVNQMIDLFSSKEETVLIPNSEKIFWKKIS